MPPDMPIICRRMHISFDPSRSEDWYQVKTVEDWLNALSFVLPVGEKYFIQSVQHYQDRITDPVLRDQVRRFIFQEAMHSREHARCNDAQRLAYPEGAKIEKLTARLVALNRACNPWPSWHLASTCALEHFTAMLAHDLLRAQDAMLARSNDPAFATLWLWHAVEETEHRAVAFDVYTAVCGQGVLRYLQRIAAMLMMTAGFLVLISCGIHWIRKSSVPRRAPPTPAPAGAASPNRTWRFIRGMVSLGFYFDYYRPSFHPGDKDSARFVEAWKARAHDFDIVGDTPKAATAS